VYGGARRLVRGVGVGVCGRLVRGVCVGVWVGCVCVRVGL